tara:strand:- start:538 stop:984 length:447 start_codon:yes stop_codon:yes gene_type:complete
MILRFFNLNVIFLLLSCSYSFDKEIVNYGPNLKSFDKINIINGKTSKSIIIKNLGPPSFINPYDTKNVYYISQKMNKKIGKVNQFVNANFLEIFYNESDKVVKFNLKNVNLPNDIVLSELDDKPISENRVTFELFKNIFSNLRRRNDN